MAKPDPDSLQTARTEFSLAVKERTRTIAALATASAALTKMTRQAGADHAAVVAAEKNYLTARTALETARVAEKNASATLRMQLAVLQQPAEAIAGLNSGFPIMMFPVRIETRFIRFAHPIPRPPLAPQVGELRVRIYPDAILADSHEPLLSEVEVQAGRDYWNTAWANTDEQDAWTALVAAVGAPRAAWIVRRCEPINVAAFPRSASAAAVAPAPVFPAPETRPPNWHRAPVARLLPDQWVIQAQPDRAVTEAERLRYRVLSRPVAEPLALTLGFTADGVTDDRIELAAGLKVDPDILWTVDFGEAEQVGMAARIPLAEQDFQDGFHRVTVLGVKASLAPQQAAQQLQDLLDHHRVSRGWAFVPQGTPTNSTADATSGYPPPDPRATESFRVERGLPLAGNGTDGARFMAALGLPAQAADHIAGADKDEQKRARAMAVALWPATMGYYLKQMLASELDVPQQPADLSDATVEALRMHFIDLVRGRGPFPAFRIGDIPYGVLPVSLLEQSAAAPASSLDANLLRIVSELQRTLSSLAAQYAPRVGRTNDPDADLMETFRMDASAREVYVRAALGETAVDNVAELAGIDDLAKIHAPISLDAPIDLGGPIPMEMTLKTLLAFSKSEPGIVTERPRNRGVPNG